MDITSVEFYTLAFVVAMALVALLMGRTEKKPPSTYIVQLMTNISDEETEAEDTVLLQPTAGTVQLKRTGISIAPEDTVNLVITVQEDSCSIVEKKGRKSRSKGIVGDPAIGEAVLKCLRPGTKYHMRYESQLNSTWATFTLDTSSQEPRLVKLNF